MTALKSVLPGRYSPLQANGNGNQALYLTELPQNFAEVLGGLIGEEARMLTSRPETLIPAEAPPITANDDLDVWERRLEEQVQADSSVQETDREAIIRARWALQSEPIFSLEQVVTFVGTAYLVVDGLDSIEISRLAN